MRRFLRWIRDPEVIGAPDCPLILRWTIFAALPADEKDAEKERRYALFILPSRLGRDRKLMVHRFLPQVEDRDPHDHPRSFWTFVLRGRYYDLVPCDFCKGLGTVIDPTEIQGMPTVSEGGEYPRRSRVPCWECEGVGTKVGDVMKPGTLRFRPAEHTHVTQSGPKGAWTLVLMGPFERPWGFLRDAVWWPFKKYEKEFGFAMRCPSEEEREGRMLKYSDAGVVAVPPPGPPEPPVPPPGRAWSDRRGRPSFRIPRPRKDHR